MTAQSKKGTPASTFKKGLAIVAAVTVLGTAGSVIAGTLISCQNPANSSTEITDEYDKDGYDKYGYNTDGFNKQGYDKDGYDRDGYNAGGLDRDGKKKPNENGNGGNEGGNENGGNEGGNENGGNITGLPASYPQENVNIPTMFGYSTMENLYDTRSYGGSFQQIAILNYIYSSTAPQLGRQSNDLLTAYTAVAAQYPNGTYPNFTTLKNLEQAIKGTVTGTTTDWDNYGNTVKNLVNTALGNIDGSLINDIAAYQKGKYIDQKMLFGGQKLSISDEVVSTDNAESRDTLNAQFQTLLTAAGITTTLQIDPATKVINNLNTVLNTLETRILTKLDNATGVGTAATLPNTGNHNTIKGLNEKLLTQIGEDLGQWQAMADDLSACGYNVDLIPLINDIDGGPIQIAAQRTHLNGGLNPQYLAQATITKDDGIAMA
jgi:hypothetical protein